MSVHRPQQQGIPSAHPQELVGLILEQKEDAEGIGPWCTSGLSFFWRRALGISQAQAKLSRQIGIPLSRSGRQRKIGRMTGFCIPLLIGAGVLRAILWME